MKNRVWLILLIMVVAYGTVKSQTVSNVSITGNLASGSEVTAAFIVSGPAPESIHYRWCEGTTLADTTHIGSDSNKLTVPPSAVGKRLLLKVSLWDATKVVDSAYSTFSSIVTLNQPPVASSVFIDGSLNVNDYLLGNYSYSDGEGDLEGATVYQWRISSQADGSGSTEIASTNSRNYKIKIGDQGKYLIFTVKPVAATGTLSGITVYSAAYGPVNSAPAASSVYISGAPVVGSTLTGEYTFSDDDPADSEGTSIFKWFRDGVLISAPNSKTYTLTTLDVNARISFEVTPVSASGFPDTGTPVLSSETAIVTDPSGDKPRAQNLCISGSRMTDSILVGKYTFYDAHYDEKGTKFFWKIGGVLTAPGNDSTYKVKASDLNKEIVFGVIPKNKANIVGDTAFSAPLAIINLQYNTFSIADPGIILQATPGGGIFDGPGVTSGKFVPSIAGIGGPYTIRYNSVFNTCSQFAYSDVYVNPSTHGFAGFDPYYCYGSGYDTIYVTNVDPAATSGTFEITNPSAVVAILSDTSIVIDISKMRAGDKRDTLFYSYIKDFSLYPISRPFVIDSIGELIIQNLTAGDRFCTNDAPFELYTNLGGGTFSGPVIGPVFTPSTGLGAVSVTYSYVNSTTGCSKSVLVPVVISSAPQVSFTAADFCIENGADSTQFINNTNSSDPVTAWQWAFFEGGGVGVSDVEEPVFLYKTGGLHQVRLTAVTSENCTNFFETNIDLGVKPDADFYWLNECFLVDDSVSIFDRTISVTPVTSRTWNFFDGGPLRTVLNPKILKDAPGYKPVEYIVYTNYLNCYDTVRQEIFIRPTVTLMDSDDYYEDFESGPGGWIADAGINNSWTFGTPDRPIIDYAASGVNAWYTDIITDTVQSSSVSSPCFDFTDSERPMISLKLWKRFDRNRDGASLQYKLGDNPDWVNLGTIDDGINWYNSTQIKGRPGGDQTGWTSVVPDTSWLTSNHRLDELIGQHDVKFRIAYGSDGTSDGNDGVAFDDIRISSRSRMVLLEHFTNNSSNAVVPGNVLISDIVNEMATDVINIQYHTNFPGTDQFYWDIPSEMSARVLFYGLTKVPWASVDGGTGMEYDGVFNFTPLEIADPDVYRNMLIKRSLISPKFEINVTPTLSSGGQLVVSSDLKALEDINAENLTLYVSVTAREITSVTGANGETKFINTLRRMLPDGGGTNLPKNWIKNQTMTPSDLSWQIQNLYDAEDIEIIAYVQNNVTHEILQTESSVISGFTVGVEDIYGTRAGFLLYPNPTTGKLTVSFEEPLALKAEIEIVDYRGAVVRQYSASTGQGVYIIDDLGLTNGIYMVRIVAGNQILGLRKLLVSGR